MIVIGIDPGTIRCGYAVLEGGHQAPPLLVASGVVKVKGTTALARSPYIAFDVWWAIRAFLPSKVDETSRPITVLCTEAQFVGRNAGTALKLAYVSGMVAGFVASDVGPGHVRLLTVAPRSPKKVATGNGDASKEDVIAAVADRFPREDPYAEDEADAVAVALAALHSMGMVDP